MAEQKLLSLLDRDGKLSEPETQDVQQILLKWEEIRSLALALLAPIRGVSEEILGRIFRYAASVEPLPCDKMKWCDQIELRERCALSLDTPPLVLFRVCKTWRRVALQTPEIFQRLIHVEDTSLRLEKILPMWLRHSGTLPLDIHLFCPDMADPIPMTAENQGAFHLTMATNMHRLTSLSLHMLHLRWLLPAGICLEAPVLRMLRLGVIRQSDVPKPSSVGQIRTPALTDLYLDYILKSFKWWNVIKHKPRQLRRFRASSYRMSPGRLLSFLNQHPNLEYFEGCSDTPTNGVQPSLARRLLSCLNQRPNLEYFEGRSDVPTNGVQRSLVTHPCLKSLAIGYIHTVTSTLLNLRTPNLKSLEVLEIDNEDGVVNAYPLWQISDWIETSQLSLQNLTIQLQLGRDITENFHDLLELLSSLETLHIETGGLMRMDVEGLEILNRFSQPNILPSLLRLTLQGMFISPSGLHMMLQSRLSPCDEWDSSQKLKEFKGVSLIWEHDEEALYIPSYSENIDRLEGLGRVHPEFTITLERCENPTKHDLEMLGFIREMDQAKSDWQ